MKKTYLMPLAMTAMVALQACNQQTPPTETTASASAAEPKLEAFDERLSYGIAYSLGQRMSADDLPLNNDAFILGVSDALSGSEPRMTQEEMQAEMQKYQEDMMAKQEEAQAALGDANKAAAEAFLAENAAREGVLTTESGLQYEVLEQGDGAKPTAEDTVEVHYRGTLVDGTEFDSSYNRGAPVTFGVGQVIPGWTEALQLMNTGSKYKLAIPSDLAYGPGGAGQVIGPNAALLFEVELLSIPSQAEGEEAAEETAASGDQ